jgi:predicted permease
VFRQLLTEAWLLSAAGGVVSVALTAWGARLLVRLASNVGSGTPLTLSMPVDGRLLLFTAGAVTFAGLCIGSAPALREIRGARMGLADAARRTAGRERTWGLRGVLMAAQVALCLVLVAGSVMFVRTLRNLESQDLGFRPQGLFRIEIESERGYRATQTVVSTLLTGVAALPGVDAATAVAGGTLVGLGGVNGLQVPGFTPRTADDQRARADWVGPDYFRSAGIRLLRGREFSAHDDAAAPKVVVVNETAAAFYFGAHDAVGGRLTFNGNDYTVVGVSADAKYASLRDGSPRLVYFALFQNQVELNAIEVRSSAADAAALAEGVRRTIRATDAHLRMGEVLAASDRIDRTLGREHLVATLSSAFGGLTLLLVAIGVYGTLAYAVSRRTRELGVRLALGATRLGVVSLVLRELLAVVVAGMIVGGALTLLLGGLVKSLLFGLATTDAATFVVATAVLAAAALLAGLVPVLRACRLDPADVLRE